MQPWEFYTQPKNEFWFDFPIGTYRIFKFKTELPPPFNYVVASVLNKPDFLTPILSLDHAILLIKH